MSHSRNFFEHYTDAAIVRMMAGDDATRAKAWSIIVEALEKPKVRFLGKHLRKRGLVEFSINDEHITCEECFMEVDAYVFENALTLEKLDLTFAAYDPEQSPLMPYLMSRIDWAVRDWFKINFKRHQQQKRRRQDVDVSLAGQSTDDDDAGADDDADRALDEHIHALNDKGQAVFSLHVHPIYPLSRNSREVVHDQAAESGQSSHETDQRIEELEVVAGDKAASQREAADDRLEAAWSDIQQLRQEIELREARMLARGVTPAEIARLKESAAQTGLVREVEARYAGATSDEPFLRDRQELECDIVRLHQALDRHNNLEEGKPVTATSGCIAGCLNWSTSKVYLHLCRAKKKFCAIVGPLFGLE